MIDSRLSEIPERGRRNGAGGVVHDFHRERGGSEANNPVPDEFNDLRRRRAGATQGRFYQDGGISQLFRQKYLTAIVVDKCSPRGQELRPYGARIGGSPNVSLVVYGIPPMCARWPRASSASLRTNSSAARMPATWARGADVSQSRSEETLRIYDARNRSGSEGIAAGPNVARAGRQTRGSHPEQGHSRRQVRRGCSDSRVIAKLSEKNLTG